MSEVYYETVLPNFKYKDGKIMFLFKRPIKLDIMKKIIWMNECDIEISSFYNKIDYDYGKISYRIFEDESNDNLNIKIYENNNDLSKNIGDIVKNIEENLLKIYINNSEDKGLNKKINDDNFTIYSKKKYSSNTKLSSYDYDDYDSI
jgi:hypothetical protein